MRNVISVVVATWGLGLASCSGDLDLEDMTCDETGCFHCGDGRCEEYRCDETHQCPMDRVCTTDHHCLPEGVETGDRCTAHTDCAEGEICTLDGDCVTSPGGGKGDVDDGSDAEVSDTGPELPDHPDNVCRVNGDCGIDGTCVNGGCYFPCTVDHKCPPGQACGDLGCRAALPENLCTYNLECGTDHACLEGTCYERCEETAGCMPHTRCSTGICIADLSPVLQCSGAGSCHGGNACVDGKCLAACQSGACGDGFTCDLGYCNRATACFNQDQCAGKDCVDGACLP